MRDDFGDLDTPYQATAAPGFASKGHATDKTGGLIPYKNPLALTSYYLGIAALLPLIGILPAIPAVVLGVMGFLRYRANPIIRGQVHAIIGLVLGLGSIMVYGGGLLLLLLTMLFSG